MSRLWKPSFVAVVILVIVAEAAVLYGLILAKSSKPAVLPLPKAGLVLSDPVRTLPVVPDDKANMTKKPGTKDVLAILWDWHQVGNPQPTKTAVEQALVGSAPSVADYFRDESGGQAEVNFRVLGWYDAPYPFDHYGQGMDEGDQNGDGFINPHVEKWAEAIRSADRDFDYSVWDLNHDGYLDPTAELGVLVVIANSSPFGTNRPVVGREFPKAEPLVVDGVTVPVVAEAYIGDPPSLSIVAHELGHLLWDMPDEYGGPNAPGAYSMLDDAYNASRLDPYVKIRAGWLSVEKVTVSGYRELQPVGESRRVIAIDKPGSNGQEYLVLEDRVRGVYDHAIPTEGVAVWRIIDSTAGDWGRTSIRLLRAPRAQDALVWSDGTPTKIELSDISAVPGGVRFYLNLP